MTLSRARRHPLSPSALSSCLARDEPTSPRCPVMQLPDDVLLLVLTHLACSDAVPGGNVDGGPTFAPGQDAIVVAPIGAPALRARACVSLVSRRWRGLASAVRPWCELDSLDVGHGLDDQVLRPVHDDSADILWDVATANSPRGCVWRTVCAPGGDRSVVVKRRCYGNGIANDLVRWMGCLQSMHHPCVAAMHFVRIQHDAARNDLTLVHMGMEHVDTSLQELIYAQPDRTSNWQVGRPLACSTIRSVLYQVLHALAYCHARGVSHGNVAPYRILAKTVDADRGLYHVKLGDFGFSPPRSAQRTWHVPVRPSRHAPEIQGGALLRYGAANDMWAVGTIMVEMAYGCRNPSIFSSIRFANDMSDAELSAAFADISADGRDLLRRLLRTSPSHRITALEALHHPFFDDLRAECSVVSEHLPCATPSVRFADLRVLTQWSPGQDVMASQPHITAPMWNVLCDWMVMVGYKMELEARTLPVAFHFLLRYLAQVHVRCETLQLVGMCAMCIAYKMEEVWILNMDYMASFCDGAYTTSELLSMEADMLTMLRFELHVPTAHDLVMSMIDLEAPDDDDVVDAKYRLREWCHMLVLIGQVEYRVALHGPHSLARCIATLGGTLGGKYTLAPGCLRKRACYLRSEADWMCLRQLVLALDDSVQCNREMLLHSSQGFAKLDSVARLLAKYRCEGHSECHLSDDEARGLVDRFYPARVCEREGTMCLMARRHDDNKKAYYRRRRLCAPDDVSIVTITAALAKQLLRGRGDAT